MMDASASTSNAHRLFGGASAASYFYAYYFTPRVGTD